jgi:hypothetical protein
MTLPPPEICRRIRHVHALLGSSVPNECAAAHQALMNSRRREPQGSLGGLHRASGLRPSRRIHQQSNPDGNFLARSLWWRPRCLESLPTQQSISEFDQPSQFLLLLRDPVRSPVFIFGTRVGSGLFDQLIDILPYQGNALVKFSNRGSSHRLFSQVESIQLSWNDS